MAKAGKRRSLLEMALGDEGLAVNPDQYRQLPLDIIKPGPWQVRTYFDADELKLLADTIRKQGILQPLLVRPESDFYFIIAGERRWRAAQLANIDVIPCIVKSGLSDRDASLCNLLENLQRSDLNPIDEGRGYQTAIDNYSLTQQELAEVLSITVDRITRTRHLLDLDVAIQTFVAAGDLSTSHALVLRGLSANNQRALADLSIRRDWSVQMLKDRAQRLKNNADGRRKKRTVNPAIQALNKRLSNYLSVPVNIQTSRTDKDSGELRIKYTSQSELSEILSKIGLPKDA